jgi:hypothetical protein
MCSRTMSPVAPKPLRRRHRYLWSVTVIGALVVLLRDVSRATLVSVYEPLAAVVGVPPDQP